MADAKDKQVTNKNLGNSTPPAKRAPCQAPKGEANALANPGQRERGAVSGVLEPDPLVERVLQAVIDKAKELGVELEGKVWHKLKNRSYEIHAGRPKLGTLTQDQFVRCDVEHLFKLHRAVELDIIALPDPEEEGKPQDEKAKAKKNQAWSEFSSPLFAILWALGNLMDAALDEVRLADRQPGDSEKKVAPQTLSYRVLTSETEQDRLRAEAAKHFMRTKYAIWKNRSEFSISGATASCASNMVHTLYKQWRDGEIGYPSWRGPGGIIPVRADNFSLKEEPYKDDTHTVCTFKVVGGKGTTHKCIVAAKGDSARVQLKRIIKGEYEHGDAKLMWDERKRRWRISLSYTMPRQAAKGLGTGYLAIRRSVQDMLFVMTNVGERIQMQGMGNKILHIRKQFANRKRKVKSGLNFQGKGARGHGKTRFFRLYTKLQDKEARTFDTLLKQLASAIRHAAEEANAKVVFLEDMGLPWNPTGGDPSFVKMVKRMPWADAETKLRHELDEHGIQLRTVANAHNVSKCPSCGAENTKITDDYVDCTSCGLLCDRHIIATWNMFLAAGVDVVAMAETKRKASFITRALRKREHEAVQIQIEAVQPAAE